MTKSNLVDIQVVLVHKTDKAWLLRYDEDKPEVWVPRSQGELEQVKTSWVLTCPQWFAEEK